VTHVSWSDRRRNSLTRSEYLPNVGSCEFERIHNSPPALLESSLQLPQRRGNNEAGAPSCARASRRPRGALSAWRQPDLPGFFRPVSIDVARAELLARWPSVQSATLPAEAEGEALLRQRLNVVPLSSGFSGLRAQYGTTLSVLLALMGILLAGFGERQGQQSHQNCAARDAQRSEEKDSTSACAPSESLLLSMPSAGPRLVRLEHQTSLGDRHRLPPSGMSWRSCGRTRKDWRLSGTFSSRIELRVIDSTAA
jgi:hypothetical protein